MKYLKSITIAMALIAVTGHLQATAAELSVDSIARVNLAGRKTVTVSADSASEALALAERKHPAWTAIKAKKTGSGRFWQVTMVKS